MAKTSSHIIPGNMSFFEFSTKENIWFEIRDFNHNLLYRSTINENGFNESKKNNEAIGKKEGKLGSNRIMLLEFPYSNVGKNNWFRRIILKIKGFPKYLDENLEVEVDRLADKAYMFFLGVGLKLIFGRFFNRNNRNNGN
jgi:hypothetical protein